MATHPFIPLYVDDYDAATAHLTPAQDGIYGRLLRLCWRTPGCCLPADEPWIARKVRLTATEWDRVGKPVLAEFFTPYRGRLTQKRLKREYDDISRKKSARVAAGKKGGVEKARKRLANSPSNATVLLTDTRAFPEPYPEPEKKEVEGAQVVALPAAERPQGGIAATPRGSRLRPDWTPSADNHAYAASQGFAGREVDRIAEAFRDYWIAAAGQKATKLDWSAAWRTWVRNERDRRPKPSGLRQGFV